MNVIVERAPKIRTARVPTRMCRNGDCPTLRSRFLRLLLRKGVGPEPGISRRREPRVWFVAAHVRAKGWGSRGVTNAVQSPASNLLRQPPSPKALRRSGKHYGGQEVQSHEFKQYAIRNTLHAPSPSPTSSMPPSKKSSTSSQPFPIPARRGAPSRA